MPSTETSSSSDDETEDETVRRGDLEAHSEEQFHDGQWTELVTAMRKHAFAVQTLLLLMFGLLLRLWWKGVVNGYFIIFRSFLASSFIYVSVSHVHPLELVVIRKFIHYTNIAYGLIIAAKFARDTMSNEAMVVHHEHLLGVPIYYIITAIAFRLPWRIVLPTRVISALVTAFCWNLRRGPNMPDLLPAFFVLWFAMLVLCFWIEMLRRDHHRATRMEATKFLDAVTHQIRTPMQVLQIMLQEALSAHSAGMSANVRLCLRDALNAYERMAIVVDDMLIASKLGSYSTKIAQDARAKQSSARLLMPFISKMINNDNDGDDADVGFQMIPQGHTMKPVQLQLLPVEIRPAMVGLQYRKSLMERISLQFSPILSI